MKLLFRQTNQEAIYSCEFDRLGFWKCRDKPRHGPGPGLNPRCSECVRTTWLFFLIRRMSSPTPAPQMRRWCSRDPGWPVCTLKSERCSPWRFLKARNCVVWGSPGAFSGAPPSLLWEPPAPPPSLRRFCPLLGQDLPKGMRRDVFPETGLKACACYSMWLNVWLLLPVLQFFCSNLMEKGKSLPPQGPKITIPETNFRKSSTHSTSYSRHWIQLLG